MIRNCGGRCFGSEYTTARSQVKKKFRSIFLHTQVGKDFAGWHVTTPDAVSSAARTRYPGM